MSGRPQTPKPPGALPPAPTRKDAEPAPASSIPSATLLQGRDSITIEHNGRLYQLRQTRQGKLILTK